MTISRSRRRGFGRRVEQPFASRQLAGWLGGVAGLRPGSAAGHVCHPVVLAARGKLQHGVMQMPVGQKLKLAPLRYAVVAELAGAAAATSS